MTELAALVDPVEYSPVLLAGVASHNAPDAGQSFVLIEKPCSFGHGGVDPPKIGNNRTHLHTAVTTSWH